MHISHPPPKVRPSLLAIYTAPAAAAGPVWPLSPCTLCCPHYSPRRETCRRAHTVPEARAGFTKSWTKSARIEMRLRRMRTSWRLVSKPNNLALTRVRRAPPPLPAKHTRLLVLWTVTAAEPCNAVTWAGNWVYPRHSSALPSPPRLFSWRWSCSACITHLSYLREI